MNELPPSMCDDWASARALCAELVATARLASEGRLVVSLPVPSSLREALLTEHWRSRFEEMVVHRRAEGPLILGFGSAVRIQARSNRPFCEIAETLTKLQIICPSHVQPYVRFFGGGAFDPRRTHGESCWVKFGTGSLVLPQLTYWDFDGRAALVLAFGADELELVLSLLEALQGLAEAPAQPAAKRGLPPDAARNVVSRRDSADETAWASLLQDAQRSIATGALHKVVAARRVTVELDGPPRLNDLIERLLHASPSCTVFALGLGQKIFFGATPETLIEKCGDSVATEALAGTRALADFPSSEQAARALLASDKDRAEHAFVVQEVERVLSELCSVVEVQSEPEARFLRGMVHLRTPMMGRLAHPVHVLQLVDKLHPTPAVGGLPQRAAMDFIAEHELAERGWYAAPIGWCTVSGDGHFSVALRSALLSGNKVHVYAGAGIVERSDPASEYRETELKMSSVLHSLGLAS